MDPWLVLKPDLISSISVFFPNQHFKYTFNNFRNAFSPPDVSIKLNT